MALLREVTAGGRGRDDGNHGVVQQRDDGAKSRKELAR